MKPTAGLDPRMRSTPLVGGEHRRQQSVSRDPRPVVSQAVPPHSSSAIDLRSFGFGTATASASPRHPSTAVSPDVQERPLLAPFKTFPLPEDDSANTAVTMSPPRKSHPGSSELGPSSPSQSPSVSPLTHPVSSSPVHSSIQLSASKKMALTPLSNLKLPISHSATNLDLPAPLLPPDQRSSAKSLLSRQISELNTRSLNGSPTRSAAAASTPNIVLDTSFGTNSQNSSAPSSRDQSSPPSPLSTVPNISSAPPHISLNGVPVTGGSLSTPLPSGRSNSATSTSQPDGTSDSPSAAASRRASALQDITAPEHGTISVAQSVLTLQKSLGSDVVERLDDIEGDLRSRVTSFEQHLAGLRSLQARSNEIISSFENRSGQVHLDVGQHLDKVKNVDFSGFDNLEKRVYSARDKLDAYSERLKTVNARIAAQELDATARVKRWRFFRRSFLSAFIFFFALSFIVKNWSFFWAFVKSIYGSTPLPSHEADQFAEVLDFLENLAKAPLVVLGRQNSTHPSPQPDIKSDL